MSQGELEVIAALQQLVITLRRHYIARAMLQLSASLLFAGGMVSIFSTPIFRLGGRPYPPLACYLA